MHRDTLYLANDECTDSLALNVNSTTLGIVTAGEVRDLVGNLTEDEVMDNVVVRRACCKLALLIQKRLASYGIDFEYDDRKVMAACNHALFGGPATTPQFPIRHNLRLDY